MSGGRSYSPLVYGAAGVLSLLLHAGFLLMPVRADAMGPRLPVQQGRVSVDVAFIPPKPPRTEKPAEQRKPVRKRAVPDMPSITVPEEPMDITGLIEKPDTPARLKPPAPAADDLPEYITPAEENEASDVDGAPEKDVGARAPILAPENGKPEYPRACRLGLHRRDRSPCEGTAKFLVTVGVNGKAVEITLLESAGCRHLDDSAMRWLLKARFLPAMRNGRAVKQDKIFKVTFTMEDSTPFTR